MRSSGSSYSYDAPGVALGTAKQGGGRGVADNFLCLGVPTELPSQADGDDTQVANAGGAMRNLGGRDSQTPRLHAVEEIAYVIGRIVEVDLSGSDLVLHQTLGVGLKPAPVNPDPAVGPNPLGAHAMLSFRVLEDHLHAVGISAFNPVARGRIPDTRLGELKVNGIDLHRAGVFGAKAPLSDVAVMADPVHKLAAAVIHLPAPVPMSAVRGIGRHGRRAAPKVVVKLRRRIGKRGVAAGAAHGQADFHRVHLANSAIAHQLTGEAEIPRGPLPRASLPNAPVLAEGRDHGSALPQVVAERLF